MRICKLSEVCTIIAGQSPDSKYYNTNGEGLPFFQGKADFGELYPSIRVFCSQPTKIAEKDDILLSVRAPVGPTNLAPCKVCIGRGLTAIRPGKELLTKYVLLFFRFFQAQLENQGTGTTFKAITQDIVKNLDIPVPAIEMQEAIVSRVEELFSQLDNGVETLNKAKQQLAVYRQAVLKDAFSGVYTVNWRNDHPTASAYSDYQRICIRNVNFKDTSGDENEIMFVLPATWRLTRIGEVFDVEVGATPSRAKSEYWNGQIHWVSSGEVRFNTILSTNECITHQGVDNSSTKVHPVGTVMLAMIGEGKTRGQAAILGIEAAHNQNTAAILVSKTPCNPKYLYYFFQLNYDHTRRVGSGNNQKALNKERVKAIHFPMAPFSEQNEIVTEIEAHLSVCEHIESIVNEALQKAVALRQSILKQAFEGRL